MYGESWTICTISSTPTWGGVSAYYAPGREEHEIKASQWLWMEAWIARKAGKRSDQSRQWVARVAREELRYYMESNGEREVRSYKISARPLRRTEGLLYGWRLETPRRRARSARSARGARRGMEGEEKSWKRAGISISGGSPPAVTLFPSRAQLPDQALSSYYSRPIIVVVIMVIPAPPPAKACIGRQLLR